MGFYVIFEFKVVKCRDYEWNEMKKDEKNGVLKII